MRSDSLIVRLVISITVLTGVIVVISGLATGVIVYVRTEREMENILSHAAATLIADHITVKNGQLLSRLADNGQTIQSRLREMDVSLVVYDERNVRIGTYGVYLNLSETGNIQSLIPDGLFSQIQVGKKAVYVDRFASNGIVYDTYSAPLLLEGNVIGMIQVAKEARILQSIITALPQILFAVLPLSLVITSILTWLIARRGLSPLKDFVSTVSIIDADHVPSKVMPYGHSREISILAHAFNAMLGRIKTGIERQKAFTSYASHELKAPLARAVSDIDLLIMTSPGHKETKNALSGIREELLSLGSLINSVLSVTGSENGKAEGFFGTPETIISSILNSQRSAIESKHLSVTVRIDGQIISKIPEDQLILVLSNIIGNAVKYSNTSGKIDIIGNRMKDMYRLSIRDTGIGMVKDERDHIFDRFYRGHAARGVQGHGIGLGLVKDICEKFGIRCRILSEKMHGTTVYLEIPEILRVPRQH